MGIFVKLGWFFKKERWNYLTGVLFLILTAIAQVVTPKIIGNLVDAMNSRRLTVDSLLSMLLILIISAVAQYFFRYMWRTRIWGGAARLEKLLRTRLFGHFMAMDTTFYQQNRTGDLMAHATNDLSAIQMVAGSGILTFADSIITGGATIIAMLTLINWRLTLIAIVPLPFLAVMARFLGSKIHVAFKESQAAFSRLNNKTQESVMGIKVIKALGQERQDIGDFEEQVQQTIRINRRVNFLDALFDPLTTLIIGLSYVATIVLGGYFVVHHVITIGQMVAFISYISMLIWPMFAIGRLFNVMERGNASYDRVQELLDEQSQIVDAKNGLTIAPKGALDFQIKKFSYPDDHENQLEDVQFNIPEGQTIGIVGRIGAGKTTILKLIMRQFDQYQGEIRFGGHNIKDYRLDSYLPAIGYVPQDSFLFSTSIRENIRFADPTLSDAGVKDAAVKSALHTDVMNLPAQYDTQVGEQGVSLSGGQKQRLAIARALVINPELLILDDALSAVDARTEAAILQHIRADRQGKTTMIVAQRLSSVVNADQIIVLDHGKVIQRGTHAELLATTGWYQDMFKRQELANHLDEGGQQ